MTSVASKTELLNPAEAADYLGVDSEPIEGEIFMEAMPGNGLRLFHGAIMDNLIPILIGLYRSPDKMIYSTFIARPEDPRLLQGEMLYGDCIYEDDKKAN